MYRVSKELEIDLDEDIFYLEGVPYLFSSAKKYLLRYYDNLCTKYRMRVVWNSKGEPRVFYNWDNILQEAYEKMLIPSNHIARPESQQFSLFSS